MLVSEYKDSSHISCKCLFLAELASFLTLMALNISLLFNGHCSYHYSKQFSDSVILFLSSSSLLLFFLLKLVEAFLSHIIILL